MSLLGMSELLDFTIGVGVGLSFLVGFKSSGLLKP